MYAFKNHKRINTVAIIYIFIFCLSSSFFSFSFFLYVTAMIHTFFLFSDLWLCLLIEFCAFLSLLFLLISVFVHCIYLYWLDFILMFLISSSCQIHFIILQNCKHSKMQKNNNRLYLSHLRHYCCQHVMNRLACSGLLTG